MLEIGTKVIITGPSDIDSRAVRDIWWNKSMDCLIGTKAFISDIENPYYEEEEYYGNIVYALHFAANDNNVGYWFVDEWLTVDICDDIDDENIIKCMSITDLLGI